MGTVKYTGPVASFHCPTNAEIRSLKVHFSPKQLGEGDPSPENVREIVGWDGVVVHNDDGNIVPEEYQKVEYIQTLSGGTYIDSGVVMSLDLVFEIDFQLTETTIRRYFMGEYAGGSFYLYTGVGTGTNAFFQTAFGAPWQNTTLLVDTNRHRFMYSFSNGRTTVKDGNDVIWDRAVVNLSDHNILVAGTPSSGIPVRTFSSKMTKNGTVIQNLIPCRRKSDNKPGMYDTVTQTFFINQGTGEFICGPDVGQTTDYEFGVLGKNKFNNAVPYKPIEGANYKIQNKEDLLAGLATGQMIFYGLSQVVSIDEEILYNINNQVNVVMKVAPNATYCFSGSIDDGARTENFIKGFSYFDANYIKLSTGTQTNGVFTVPNDSRIKYACVYVHNYAQSSSQNPWSISDVLNSLQIELGSTATEYEPYNPNHTVCGGWVDLISGEVAEEWIQFSASNVTWVNTSAANVYRTVATAQRDTSELGNVLSDTYKAINAGIAIANMGDLTTKGHATNKTYLYIKDTRYANAEEFAENTNAVIVYALETPNTYYLAPTQLQTFLGQNNVWSNADYVEVEYDLHETQTILARKQFIMANQPHIVRPAAASLQNFKTDMIAPLKECKIYFEPVQEGSGDPSPDNVRPISGWTGVEVCNSIINSHDVFSGTIVGSSEKITVIALEVPAGEYVVATNVIDNQNSSIASVFGFAKNHSAALPVPTSGGAGVFNNIPRTVTVSNGQDLCIGIRTGSGGYLKWSEETFAPYYVVAYKSDKIVPIDWTDSAGTVYGGYVDLVTGEVVKEWETVKIADLNWYNYSGKIHYYAMLSSRERNTYIYTDTLTPCTTGVFTQETVGELTYYGEGTTATYKYIWTKVPEAMELAEANEWIKNTYADAIICYKLETPTLITILTPTQLKTLRGTNNIWSNANGNIEATYWTH